MDSIKGKFTPCNFGEMLDLTEKQKQQYLDLQIAQAPVVSEGRPHTILESIERSFREIKQFKEGKTQFKTLKESQTLWDKWAEEVDEKPIEKLTTADLMLSPKLREQYYKYWDNKLAEDMQNPKLKEIFEEEDKIYKEMRELEANEYKKWEDE